MRTPEPIAESVAAGSVAADIFELLSRDHRNVRALLDEIEGAENDRERAALFAQLIDEVEAHSQAEDDVFYTSIEVAGEVAGQLADNVDDARHEHDEVESLLEELDGLPVSGDDWLEKMREIRQLIEHHVRDEEEILFPLARELLGEGEARRLGREFQLARRVVTEEVSSERLVVETTGDSTATIAQMAGTVDVSVDYEHMSKRHLYELARQRRILGRSAMTKAELVSALRGVH